MAKKQKVVKKGKKPKKNQPTSKKYSKYKISGDKVERAATCPRCGVGVFLMDARDRVYCGKCHYCEFKTGVDKEAIAQAQAQKSAQKTDAKPAQKNSKKR